MLLFNFMNGNGRLRGDSVFEGAEIDMCRVLLNISPTCNYPKQDAVTNLARLNRSLHCCCVSNAPNSNTTYFTLNREAEKECQCYSHFSDRKNIYHYLHHDVGLWLNGALIIKKFVRLVLGNCSYHFGGNMESVRVYGVNTQHNFHTTGRNL